MTAELIIGENYYLGHNRRSVVYAGLSNQEHQFLFVSSINPDIEVTEIKQDDLLYVDELRTAFDIKNSAKIKMVGKDQDEFSRLKLILRREK